MASGILSDRSVAFTDKDHQSHDNAMNSWTDMDSLHTQLPSITDPDVQMMAADIAGTDSPTRGRGRAAAAAPSPMPMMLGDHHHPQVEPQHGPSMHTVDWVGAVSTSPTTTA